MIWKLGEHVFDEFGQIKDGRLLVDLVGMWIMAFNGDRTNERVKVTKLKHIVFETFAGVEVMKRLPCQPTKINGESSWSAYGMIPHMDGPNVSPFRLIKVMTHMMTVKWLSCSILRV